MSPFQDELRHTCSLRGSSTAVISISISISIFTTSAHHLNSLYPVYSIDSCIHTFWNLYILLLIRNPYFLFRVLLTGWRRSFVNSIACDILKYPIVFISITVNPGSRDCGCLASEIMTSIVEHPHSRELCGEGGWRLQSKVPPYPSRYVRRPRSCMAHGKLFVMSRD